MPLEVATYINGLDSANPTPTDPKSQGDDHLRLVKTVLKNSFPALAGPIDNTYLGAMPLTGGAFTGPVAFTIISTSPTPTQFDNSNDIATTAFVQKALGNRSNVSIIGSTSTLTAANCGAPIFAQGAAIITLTLPALSSLPVGATIEVQSQSLLPVIVQRTGGDLISANNGNNLINVTLANGDSLFLAKLNNSFWMLLSGTAALRYSTGDFGFSSTPSGSYRKEPGGFFKQWGSSVNTGTVTSVVFPIPFPAICESLVLTAQSGNLSARGPLPSYANLTRFGFDWGSEVAGSTVTAAATVSMTWMAYGK